MPIQVFRHRVPSHHAVRARDYSAPIADAAATGPADPSPGKPQRWRGILSFVLLGLSIVCLILGSLFIWMRVTAYNPNGYVASALQVQGQVEIRKALTDYISNDLLPESRVLELAEQVTDPLPIAEDRKKLLATVLTASIRSQVGTVVDGLLDSRAGNTLAVDATQRASEEVVKLLRNDSSVFQFQGDSVVFNTAPLVKEARAALEERLGQIARFLPPERSESYPVYTVVQGSVVTTTQTAISTIRLMSWLLPVLFVVLLIMGIVVARQRRTAAFRTMVAIAIAAVVVIVGIRIARNVILGLITEPATEGVVKAILDSASINLVDQTLWLALIAAVVGGVLWLLGSDRPARMARAWLAQRGRDLVSGVPSPAGAVTQFARQYRIVLDVGALALGLIILLLIPDAGGTTWLLALVSYLIFGFLVEYSACAEWMQWVVRQVRGLRKKPAA